MGDDDEFEEDEEEEDNEATTASPRGENGKAINDDEQKNVPSPPRESEMYSIRAKHSVCSVSSETFSPGMEIAPGLPERRSRRKSSGARKKKSRLSTDSGMSTLSPNAQKTTTASRLKELEADVAELLRSQEAFEKEVKQGTQALITAQQEALEEVLRRLDGTVAAPRPGLGSNV